MSCWLTNAETRLVLPEKRLALIVLGSASQVLFAVPFEEACIVSSNDQSVSAPGVSSSVASGKVWRKSFLTLRCADRSR